MSNFDNAFLIKSNDIEYLKDNFERFLRSKYPDLKEGRIKEAKSWAFVHYRHNIGIDFWDSFKSEESLEECYTCIYNIDINGGFTGKGVKNPEADAKAYVAAIRKLKEFFDYEYGGVENYLARFNR